ncbi:MAG: hypothetical protein WCS42_17845 [Verrucomicrobiota bacterium]
MKTILNSLAIILLLTWVGALALKYSYTRQMPATPKIEQSRTNAIDAFYGKTVYVTSGEKTKLHIAYGSVLVLVLIYVGYYFWFTKKQKRAGR